MELTKEAALEKLLRAYSHQYDIQRELPVEGGVFPAAAFYRLRDETYLISRGHVLSAVEAYEYVYFCLAERLDADTLARQITLSRDDGLSRIRPHREHMSSMVTLVVLADVIDPEAKALARRTRFRKNYRLAFHGWMEYRIAAMELSTGSFLSNPAGRSPRRTLERNFPSGTTRKGVCAR